MAEKTEIKPTTVLELENGTEIKFSVKKEDYIKFTNDIQPTKKYPAMFNFLMATVHSEHKEKLGEILDKNPQCVAEYMGIVMEDYTPDLGVTVKKRSGTLIA